VAEVSVRPVRHVVYLHGFSSSPASSKAQRFGRELAARNVGFSCPDLNQPSFETLTVTRMLGQIRDEIASIRCGPIALIGSSLGALVAIHVAAADRAAATGAGGGPGTPPEGRVDRLVLLAPALDFGSDHAGPLGAAGIAEWRKSGKMSVFHHADNSVREIGYALYEDALRYDTANVELTRPALIFQGRRDEVVDARVVEQWAAARPLADLRLVDDGHQLRDSIDLIWKESRTFLGLSG
jgi:pimeloyl-ACP methyl ester carboxylesterase